MKDQIRFQHDTQLPLQPINFELEEKLAQTMFPQKSVRTDWQWRTLFSWPKLLCVSGVVALLAMIIIKSEWLEPKIALADAFENTFVLTDNTQFRYQKIHVERFLGTASSFDHIVSIWTNNNNIRFNQTWTTAGSTDVIDNLISGIDKQSCSYSNLNPEASENNVVSCVPLFGEENMDTIAGISAVQQQYDGRFSTAMFLRQHMAELGEPNVTELQYKGKTANTIVYSLPSTLRLPEPELSTNHISLVQFTITTADQKIVEYKLFSDATLVEHVTILEDTIITDQDPDQFFTVENWKRTIEYKK